MSYQTETAAYLVTRGGYSPRKALATVRRWVRYLGERQRGGKSTASTADHLLRFDKSKSACACGGAGRDCGCSHASRDASPRKSGKAPKKRGGAGEMRVSAKGIPFRVCPRGTRLQALLFPRGKYTEAEARRWAKAHGMAAQKVTTEANHVRVRLLPPKAFTAESFRLIQLRGYERHGVRGLIACPRFAILKGGAQAAKGEKALRKKAA